MDWTIVGIIVAAVVGIGTIVVTYKPSKKKRFSWQIVSNTALLKTSKSLRDKLQYQGKSLTHPHVILIKFSNPGNLEIMPVDYDPWVT